MAKSPAKLYNVNGFSDSNMRLNGADEVVDELEETQQVLQTIADMVESEDFEAAHHAMMEVNTHLAACTRFIRDKAEEEGK